MLRLNIGSGRDWRDNCINADISDRVGADWVMDITQISWGQTVPTRLGVVTVQRDLFDEIYAMDVLEHVSDLPMAMTNCRDLLKLGGHMHIRVPYDLSWGAWQDPTHRRAFNERSWIYYTDWARYLGWFQTRFELITLDYEISDHGKSLNLPPEQLTTCPRAIDAMNVVFRKVLEPNAP